MFLYRTGKLVGVAKAIEVKVDGVTAGGSGSSMYCRWEHKPGTYTFNYSTKEASATVALEVKTGNAYFIEQSARPGFASGRVNMKEVDEEKGKSMVINMKLPVSAYALD